MFIRWCRAVAIGCGLVVAALILYVMGMSGFMRSNLYLLPDFDWYYVAGRVLADGHNYNDAAYYKPAFENLWNLECDTGVCAYPPQASIPLLLLAALEPETARGVYLTICLIGLASLMAMTIWLIRHPERPRITPNPGATAWMIPTFVMAFPPTWDAVWYGQPTSFLAPIIVGAWIAARYKHDIVAGVLLGLATYKPPLVALLGVWFLLDRRWKIIMIMGATSLLLAAYPMLKFGVVETLLTWNQALNAYGAVDVNRIGYHRVWGLPSLMASAGLPVPGVPLLMVVGSLIAGILYRYRRYVEPDDRLGLIFVILEGFVYGRGHEMLFLLPLMAGLWLHFGTCSRLWLIPLGLSLLLFYIPDRVIALLNQPTLMHWRTVAVIALGLTVLGVNLLPGRLFDEEHTSDRFHHPQDTIVSG
jgi:hypothetical protein